MATSVQKPPLNGDQKAWNLFVFRKKRDLLPISQLVYELHRELEAVAGGGGSVMDALVRAGEIETGLADSGCPDQPCFSRITDLVAANAIGGEADLKDALLIVQGARLSGEIACSHPEGFSYYGLHPLDYADAARGMASELRQHVAVIGIRSVGSALSAVVAAALKHCGFKADRITVRPEGEPYRRRARFTDSQAERIRRKLERSADFVVVDEGPGFSGSTLESVIHALEDAGVPRSNIRIICSRPVNHLRDCEMANFLQQYRPVAVGYGRRIPAECNRNLGSGLWREMLYSAASEWPANWTHLERIKHLSVDGSSLLKFEGFGRFGALIRSQAHALSEAGFSPRLLGFENGFARYKWIQGRPLHRRDISVEILHRMARYCAFRGRYCAVPSGETKSLRKMMQGNLEIEFGHAIRVPELAVCRPIYADCRMMPYEWVQTPCGDILKTDSVGHSEGHQLPGPVDIAWDLAGVIVEWELTKAEREFFLAAYGRESGDNTSSRIRAYVVAYLIHRAAYCRMGAASMQDSRDGEPLLQEYRRRSENLQHLLNTQPQTTEYHIDTINVNPR